MSKTEASSDMVSNCGDIEKSPSPERLDNKIDDTNIVDWDGPQDATNPQSWTNRKKWAHVIMVSLFALITNMAPTMCVPGINDLVAEFHVTSSTVSSLAVTIYVLGLAIGPMVISPLSETYGRLPVYHASNAIFLAFVIGCALSQTIAQFMVFRFISGCMGGTPMALGGATIADVTRPEARSIAMALFSLGPLTGPVLGPVIGGFTAGGLGWRWTFWLLAILGGTVYITAAVFMRETHPKILLEREAASLRASTGSSDLSTRTAQSHLTPSQVLVAALVRPSKLLIRSPILLVLSIYVALVFGTMYLLFTTFTDVFEGQYGFSTSVSGLTYLGLGVALVVAMVTFRTFGDRVQQSRTRADGVQQTPKPEYRLILMIVFSPCVGLGLFMYGWTAYHKVHWIVPIIGTGLIGFGAFFVLMPAQLYLVDIFGSQAAASALGANNLLRFLFGTFLPLAGPPMYEALGYGWGNTLLGFLALAFVPFPVLFYKHGERLRASSVNV